MSTSTGRTLRDIWLQEQELGGDFFKGKTIEQLRDIAGDGQLRDGNETSKQLRQFFHAINSTHIEEYAQECLDKTFPHSGLVLQDLVNEIGRRLDFAVTDGCYRGSPTRIGYDGIWKAADNYSFVIEVKTTDAYNMNLDTQADYRKRLVEDGTLDKEKSSILVVVGRKDTGGLEAQTRGSRHASDVRLISVEALVKLMHIKQSLDNTSTVDRIQSILKPLEYTRVDDLVDLIFTTSEDLQEEEEEEEEPPEERDTPTPQTRQQPVATARFREQCAQRVSSHLGTEL